jgi:hypothetical protein
MIAVAAAVAIVLAAQVLLRAPKPASPQGGGGATDVALVTQAATRTLKHGTVGFVLSARAGAGDTGTAVQGEGTADLGGKAATLNMIVAYKGGEMGMREILLDGTAYVAISIAGQSLLPTGKTWIAEQVPSQPPGTTNLIGGDPTAVLAALANQGITVRALGTKVVAGVSCTGYAVTAPGAQGTITVWINPQHLVREITANATFQLSAGGASASTAPAGPTSAGSLDLTLGFSYSAGPVVATAPPPASTMSFAAFLKQLAQNPAYRQLGQSGAS